MLPNDLIPENARPPADVRFEDVHLDVLPDHKRVRVYLHLTPFRERPNLDVLITDAEGAEVASISIVESMNVKMVFTMHLRSPQAKGPLTLTAQLVYPDLATVDQATVHFEIPPSDNEPGPVT